jgi:hypothetical protein
MACPFSCASGNQSNASTTWNEITTLKVLNIDGHPEVRYFFLDARGNAIAYHRPSFKGLSGPLDADEINVCRSLSSSLGTAPASGMVIVRHDDQGDSNRQVYGWTSVYAGKCSMTGDDPPDGQTTGAAIAQ